MLLVPSHSLVGLLAGAAVLAGSGVWFTGTPRGEAMLNRISQAEATLQDLEGKIIGNVPHVEERIKDDISSFFGFHDADGSGTLSAAELAKVVEREPHQDLNDEDLRSLLRQMVHGPSGFGHLVQHAWALAAVNAVVICVVAAVLYKVFGHPRPPVLPNKNGSLTVSAISCDDSTLYIIADVGGVSYDSRQQKQLPFKYTVDAKHKSLVVSLRDRTNHDVAKSQTIDISKEYFPTWGRTTTKHYSFVVDPTREADTARTVYVRLSGCFMPDPVKKK